MNNAAILSTAYAGPVQYYTKLFAYDNIFIEAHENYNKQTYRTRCHILSANGPLTLSMPVIRGESLKCNIKDIYIDYSKRWQAIHWRAIESAYRSSPYFIYYADDLIPFYTKQDHEKLFDFNLALHKVICDLAGIKTKLIETNEYISEYTDVMDYRNSIHPKIETLDPAFQPQSYFQVFSNKFKFIPNLSIFDLLFNMGPDTKDVLLSCIKSKT